MSEPTIQLTPAEAWERLIAGNERFTRGEMLHPSQDVDRRALVAEGQNPFAVLFGCSDSRVAAEIIFDQGLGDLFVVRTAGHVVDTTVVGSVEYGVDILNIPLIVVLGHDSCGAIAAAFHTLTTGEQANGFVRAVVDRVLPSVVNLTQNGGEKLRNLDPATLGHVHVHHTVDMLYGYSASVSQAVDEGRLAIVGLQYELREGKARLIHLRGDIGEHPVIEPDPLG